jgi:Ca2+:H+ antiporter
MPGQAATKPTHEPKTAAPRRASVLYLLVFIPISVGLWWFEANPILTFVSAAISILPLSRIVGESTEVLASFLGAAIGGLLNASMGNAPEIIIATFALHSGLVNTVKASITGSIMGNLLLTLGLVMFAGGLKYKTLKFNARAAGVRTSLLVLPVIGLMIPAIFHFARASDAKEISIEIAVVLMLVYAANLVFALITNKEVFLDPAAHGEELIEVDPSSWKKAVASLAGAAVLLAIVAEVLTDSLVPVTKTLHLNDYFAGIILLAAVSNVSEMINAVAFVRKGKTDLAVSAVVGSATQVALLVAPTLVFIGLAIGSPMDLLFTTWELFAMGSAVYIARNAMLDGEGHWLEGVMLISVYLMLAFGFYYLV